MKNYSFNLDKTSLSVDKLSNSNKDTDYWLSKSPGERIAAVELMRKINYDYDPATDRLQRVLEVVERSSG